MGRERLGERQSAVQVQPHHLRAVERPNPLEQPPLGLLSHAPHPADPSFLACRPQIGEGLDAEGGVERGDLGEPEAGNAAQLERARGHALTERVENLRAPRPIELLDDRGKTTADPRKLGEAPVIDQ